jgi:hypothetical protein
MRCKTCDYPLWQLTSRQCPECGSPFRPSDFEFTLNSVRFCCPHCEQAYYGTGAKGHLEPRMFACVGCAKTIDMDDMMLQPTEGVREEQTRVTVVPWVERRERGWFTSFFVTMGMAIGNPKRTIEAVPEGSPASRAFWYMAIHVALQIVLSGMPFVVGIFFIGAFVMRGGGAPFGFIAAFAGCAVLAPLMIVVGALVSHGVLRLTGQTAAGFGRTMHAICYSAGNNFLMAVPCIGAYLLCVPGVLWWGITAGFMLASAQKVRGWRAALAVTAPILIVFGCVIGGVVIFVVGVQRSVATTMASMPGMGSSFSRIDQAADRMAQILGGTSGAGMANGPQRPKHPAELLMNYSAQPAEFLLPGSASDTRRARVQDEPLNKYQFSFGADSGTLRGKLSADPGAGTAACRVGDFVFTYGDHPKTGADRELWLAIGWPDPDMNPNDPPEVALVRAGDHAQIVKQAEFDGLLAKQNELRAAGGLAPIPHPRLVHATNSTPPPPPTANRRSGGVWSGLPQSDGEMEHDRITSVAQAMLTESKPLRHAGELLVDDRVRPEEFLIAGSVDGVGQGDRMDAVRIGHRTLGQLANDVEKIKRYAADRAIESLLADTVAYRIGDTVFTHVGMKLEDPKVRASELWIVVGCPEASGASPTARITIACADGTTRTASTRTLPEMTAAQNRLRKTFGLAPIPLPTRVKQSVPSGPASGDPGSDPNGP